MLAYSEVFQTQQERREVWLIYPYLPGLSRQLMPISLPGNRDLYLHTVDLTAAHADDIGHR